MVRQKGQAVVEFAVVLPLFLLILFGIIYSGMLFYDYSTLSNLARSSAREAAVTSVTPTNNRYTEIEDHYKTVSDSLVTSLYTKDPNDPIKVEQDSSSGVKVTITMNLNTASTLMRMVLPDTYAIEYYMKKDQSS